MTRYARFKKKFNDSEFSKGVSKPQGDAKSVKDDRRPFRKFGNNKNSNINNRDNRPAGSFKKICLKCREPGHTLNQCPKNDGAAKAMVYCYNCGESDHNPKECVLPFSNYAHALCFLCDKKGHLASACPTNERGIYPNGGCCHFCGSVKHLARNCKPAQAAKNGNEILVSASVGANPEDDDVHEALKKIQDSSKKNKAEREAAEKPKKKVVTF